MGICHELGPLLYQVLFSQSETSIVHHTQPLFRRPVSLYIYLHWEAKWSRIMALALVISLVSENCVYSLLWWNWEFEEENNGKPSHQEIKRCLVHYLWVWDSDASTVAICFQSVYISRHFTPRILLCRRFQSTLWITISWEVSFWKPQSVLLIREHTLHPERCRGMWRRKLIRVQGRWRESGVIEQGEKNASSDLGR